MNLIKIFLLTMMILPFSVSAVDTSGNYAVWGVGKKSCFAFIQAKKNDDIERFRDYGKGFLTAYNIFTEKTYNISGNMDENQILEWLIEYCGENQMSTFESALTNFTFELYDQRKRSARGGFGR